MTGMPSVALSVRQPWSWAIIHAGKDIENRSWTKHNPGLAFRGPVCIHAGTGMTRSEYEDTADFLAHRGIECPPAADLLRGGIIGTVEIVDVVRESDSRWFFGRYGFVLRNAKPCDFIPAAGQLGFFKWSEADPSYVPAPARWMLPDRPKPKAEARREVESRQISMFGAAE